MSTLLFSQITLLELKQTLAEVVKEELKNELQALQPSKDPTDLLTRKQTAIVLGISLPTLHEFTLAGKVPAYRIGTRVRYKRDEVEQSLTQIRVVKKGGYNA